MMREQQDPVQLLARANPATGTNGQPDEAATMLVDRIVATPVADVVPPSPRRRVGLTAAVAVGAALTVAAGAAWLVQPEQSLEVQCANNSIIQAVSGDPVADCRAELERQGIDPGEMAGYVNEFGGVVVVAVGDPVPVGWQPLAAGFSQDVAVIELQEALDDVTTGLLSGCYGPEDASAIAGGALRRLGLPWSVEVRADLEEPGACAVAIAQPEESSVLLVGVGEAPPPDAPWAALGSRLNEALADECHDAATAADLAASLAADEGLQVGSEVRISTVEDPAASCSRAYVTVAGSVSVTVRGPAQ